MAGAGNGVPDGHAGDADHVVIFAPFRRDGALLNLLLAADGFAAWPCADAAEFEARLREDEAAVAVLTQEALSPALLLSLRRHLEAQPPWSELPVVLLLDDGQHNDQAFARLQTLMPRTKLNLLNRPVGQAELLAAVRVAAASRLRQLRLRDHIAMQEEMQRELNHRVKNALANVFAVYRLTRRQSASIEEFAPAFEGRFAALSRVHGALIAAGSRPQGVRELAELTLEPYRPARDAVGAERLSLDGPDCRLKPNCAVVLALVLHELATNAAKYGAFSTAEGRLSLRWTLDPPPPHSRLLRISWQEAGGPPAGAPSRRGYGTNFIVSTIRHSWRGDAAFDFRPEGLVCEMTGRADVVLAVAGPDAARFDPLPVPTERQSDAV